MIRLGCAMVRTVLHLAGEYREEFDRLLGTLEAWTRGGTVDVFAVRDRLGDIRSFNALSGNATYEVISASYFLACATCYAADREIRHFASKRDADSSLGVVPNFVRLAAYRVAGNSHEAGNLHDLTLIKMILTEFPGRKAQDK